MKHYNKASNNACIALIVLKFCPDVPETPTLSKNNQDSTIESGTPVTLTCVTTSTGLGTYTFTKDNVGVQVGSLNTFVSSGSSDSGTYSCKVSINGIESETSNSVSLNIIGEVLCVQCHILFLLFLH